jgi:signal peptidase
MDSQNLAVTALEIAALVFISSLVIGQLLGTPVLFGYVETGSMAPTMQAGDGFIAIPAAISGPIESGDVVTFRAEELHGGGLTTHRVVGKTERGYITKGDANSFTDQGGTEPPVKEAQIVAQTLQIGENPIVIPNLGTFVTAVQEVFENIQTRLAVWTGVRLFRGSQGFAYLVLGFSALLYFSDFVLSRGKRYTSRSRNRDPGIDDHILVAGFAILVVIAATSAMIVPGGTQSFGVVSAEFDSDRPTVIPRGKSSTIEYNVPNSGMVPVQTYFEPGSDEVEIEPKHNRIKPHSYRTISLTLHAPPETGHYRRFVVEHRYLAVLPAGVIESLYETHPWLPIIAIDALLGGGFYALGRLLIGEGRIRDRRREAGPPSWLPAPIAGLFGRSR